MALRADDVDLGRDAALVEQIQEGDIAAFEDLYRRYYGRLYRFCLRRMGDPHEAEEVTQEAFARAYRAMPGLRGERRFYPWLSVIASRLCIDTHRRLDRTEPSAEVDPGVVEGGHDRLEAAVDFELLQEAMTRLSTRHREVLHLREREGWSYQRIAEHYDCSLGVVEGLLFRARHALRREFLAVAGPDAGLAAGLPPVVGLGWLGRRLAGVKARASEWASALGNMPALAANSMTLAVVVSTAAAGVGSIGFMGSTPKPVSVITASPIAASSGLPAGDVAAAVPATAAPSTNAANKPAAPKAKPLPEINDAAGTFNPVAEPTKIVMLDGDEADDRASGQSTTADLEVVNAGIEPQDIVDDAVGDTVEGQR